MRYKRRPGIGGDLTVASEQGHSHSTSVNSVMLSPHAEMITLGLLGWADFPLRDRLSSPRARRLRAVGKSFALLFLRACGAELRQPLK